MIFASVEALSALSLVGQRQHIDASIDFTNIREIILLENSLCLLSFLWIVLPFNISFPAISFVRKGGGFSLGLEWDGLWLCWSHIGREY